MKRKALAAFFALCLAGALVGVPAAQRQQRRFSVTFWGAFDTMFTITAYADSQEQFQAAVDAAVLRFSELSRYYDRFAEADNIVSVATLNRLSAGLGQGEQTTVPVAPPLMALLQYGQQAAARTQNKVLPAMGAVNALWHRQMQLPPQQAAPPAAAALQQALTYAAAPLSEGGLRLHPENGTVTLDRPGLLLDYGAIAKGFATELVARQLAAMGISRLAISSGGNLRVFAPPPGRTGWTAGVQNPDAAQLGQAASVARLSLRGMAVATSGDYQRFFWYEGRRWHHLIDPATGYPAFCYRSVTVACADAGEADLFSTALFLLPYERSAALAAQNDLAALWILPDGTHRVNAQMARLLREGP